MASGQIATRLTCFALISAIEQDIRQSIRIAAEVSGAAKFLPEDVREKATKRIQDDTTLHDIGDLSNEARLLDYTDFADLAKILNMFSKEIPPLVPNQISAIGDRLERHSAVRNRVCHSRPLEPDDFSRLLDLSRAFTTDFKELGWLELLSTLKRLEKDPSFVLHLTIPEFWAADEAAILNNLPLPEFDDTGFLGRDADRRELSKLLISPHPVITLVGEGGVGKTALALRCLNDILDLAKTGPYEALIWTSLKQKTLTHSGVRDIQNAITSTLGLVQTIAQELGVPTPRDREFSDLLNEVSGFLEQFKILLVIDNLETMSMEPLRPLLIAIPPGSKVLITSKVGLGELELRYPLDHLDPGTAVSLARRYAQALNISALSKAQDGMLKDICSRLYNNPLLVKWYVACVAAGGDPMQLLQRTGTPFISVLKYCFENLYKLLTNDERALLQMLACARRPLSLTEVYYLTEDVLKRDAVEWALNTLIRSSMVRRTLDGRRRATSASVIYSLTDIAAEYVALCAPPAGEVFAKVQASLKRVRDLAESDVIQVATYKYDSFAIHAASSDERISAVFLSKALRDLRSKNYASARSNLERAKNLLPTFSEVHRVGGMVESAAGDTYKAATYYEEAVALDPKSSICRYTYALFLARHLNDYEAALSQIHFALNLDPAEPTVLTLKALTLTRLGRFNEAAGLYEQVLPGLAGRSQKWRVSTRDQAAECYRRWAEQDRKMKDPSAARQHLTRAVEILETSLRASESDLELINRLGEVLEEAISLVLGNHDQVFAQQVLTVIVRHGTVLKNARVFLKRGPEFAEVFADLIEGSFLSAKPILIAEPPILTQSVTPTAPATTADGIRLSGRVDTLSQSFGFISEDGSGKRWFFHKSFLNYPVKWVAITVGRRVAFRVGKNASGPCAVDISLE